MLLVEVFFYLSYTFADHSFIIPVHNVVMIDQVAKIQLDLGRAKKKKKKWIEYKNKNIFAPLQSADSNPALKLAKHVSGFSYAM